jgi:hypothetical protein
VTGRLSRRCGGAVISTGASTPLDTTEQAPARARTTFNAAADPDDHASNAFWEWFGRRTVEWHPAQRLAPYRPRRRRGVAAQQERLFDREGVASVG